VSLLSKRRQILHRSAAPNLWVVIDEAALRRRLGGAATMRQQLEHLIEITELPHVTFQVMPFSTGVAAGGAIILLRFPGRALADVVYLEQLARALDRAADIQHYHQVMDRLSARAEPPTATVTIIDQILEET